MFVFEVCFLQIKRELEEDSTVDSAYRGHCLPWTTLNRGQSAMHPAFWGKNSAYRRQLSQL